MRHRRWGTAAACVGAVLLVGSVAVRVVAAPALVRFPLNVDETTHYTGTSSTFVDQATLLPLAHPKREPVEITRHVRVLSGDFSRAVIQEAVTVKTPSSTDVQKYQYVIDRRSMKMVSDPRQYAFGNPKAVMHAAPGTYRVNFAMGTSIKGSYLAYIPEEDAASRLVPVEGPHPQPDVSLSVVDFASHRDGPVAPYFLAHLKALGLPMEVTAAQLEPLLRANGIDVNRALSDVGPRLTAAESRLVSTTLTKAVPLRYFFLSQGVISIEPETGALIDVHTKEQGISVQPDLRGASALQPLLRKYAAIPSVKALAEGLAKMASRPPQVAQRLTYTQTVPSSRAAADIAQDNEATMNLVKVRVPLGLALLGLILLGIGLFELRRGRRHKDSHSAAGSDPSSGSPKAEPVPAPAPPVRTYEGV